VNTYRHGAVESKARLAGQAQEDHPMPRAGVRRNGQAALAALGQTAIDSPDLSRLVGEAAQRAAEVLGTEHGAVLEVLPARGTPGPGDTLAVRAEVGGDLYAGVDRSVVAGADSLLASILESDAPVVIKDLRRETRGTPPALLERGMVSMMAVAIRERTHAWGVIAVHTTRRRSFGRDDAEFLRAVANLLALAVERHEMERERARERTRAQSAVAESEARFAKLFHASPVALVIATLAEGRILDVNERWLELLGYRREDVVGRTNAELGLSVDPAARRAAVGRFREESVIRNFELQVRRKSGDVRDVIVSAVPIEVGGEESWISSQVDITDRKRAEAERGRLLESAQSARAEAEAALERVRAIESITDSALRHLGLDELLHELLARLQRALDTEAATVFLIDDDGQTLFARAADGYQLNPAVRVRMGFGVTGLVAARGQPVVVDDYSRIDVSGITGIRDPDQLAKVNSVMGVPLRIGGTVVGVVVVSTNRPRRFTKEELGLMVLVADRVAPAIELARLTERVRGGRERQRILARRLLTAHEEERRRLAVELHDELGQILTAVKINLASLQRQSAGAGATHLREALESVDGAMERVRDLALALRPSVLDDLGLPAALRSYADRLTRDAGIQAHLSIDNVPRLEPETETACFRVGQEALTNVARHARARRVWLDLHLRDGWLELCVRDDGIGFEAAAARERGMAGASMGLLGMQERVTLLGGECKVASVPEGGTELRARLPVRDMPVGDA
jgi:PAS domain S-box-containing protein